MPHPNPQSDDAARALSFTQLICLLLASSLVCTTVARMVGLGWVASIGAGYVAGTFVAIAVAAGALALMTLWSTPARMRVDAGQPMADIVRFPHTAPSHGWHQTAAAGVVTINSAAESTAQAQRVVPFAR